MRNNIVIMLVGFSLALPVNIAAAAPKSPKLAKCSGKDRRPANPYGSILPIVDPLAGSPPPVEEGQNQERERADVHVFPETAPPSPMRAGPGNKPAVQVPPISSAGPQTIFRSC